MLMDSEGTWWGSGKCGGIQLGKEFESVAPITSSTYDLMRNIPRRLE